MATKLFKNLDTETITDILNFQSTIPVEGKVTKKEAINMILADMDTAAVKQLTANLKLTELKEAVATLKIDHGTNTLTKTVLSKRLKESFEEKGCEKWVESCKKDDVIRNFASALELPNAEKGAISTLRTEIVKEMELIGLQVVLNNLTTELLKDCCDQAGVENYENATTKTSLVKALVFKIPIAAPEKKKKAVVTVGKKLPIEKCKNYDQLFQHYNVDDLITWCKENDVKSSGNKKDLIKRILDFLAGDKENTMVNQETKKKVKKEEAKPKKNTTKKSKKVEKEESENEESEKDDEEMSDAEEKAIAAERKLRTKEESEDDNEKMSEEGDDDNMEDNEVEAPKSLKGLTLCISGSLSVNRKEAEKAIKAAGGTIATSVTKRVNILICNEDSNSAKFVKAKDAGVKVYNEDFLKNIL